MPKKFLNFSLKINFILFSFIILLNIILIKSKHLQQIFNLNEAISSQKNLQNLENSNLIISPSRSFGMHPLCFFTSLPCPILYEKLRRSSFVKQSGISNHKLIRRELNDYLIKLREKEEKQMNKIKNDENDENEDIKQIIKEENNFKKILKENQKRFRPAFSLDCPFSVLNCRALILRRHQNI